MRIFYKVIFKLLLLCIVSLQWSYGATIFVTNLNDDNNPGSLRYAIENVTSSGDVINFSVTGVITLNSSLTVSKQLTINGTSAPGYAGVPLVSLVGNGLVFYNAGASKSIVKGLHINTFGNTAIYAGNGADSLTILGCYLNTFSSSNDQYDYSSLNPSCFGIQIQNCNYPTIGGTGLYDANVIYGSQGIAINNCTGGLIKNNKIGVNTSNGYPGGSLYYYPYGSKGLNIGSTVDALVIDSNKIGYFYTAIQLTSSNGNTIKNNDMSIFNGEGININEGSNNLIFKNTINNSYIYTYNYYDGSYTSGIAININTGSNGSYFNSISQNSLSCNQGGGIVLNGTNENYAAPIFGASGFALIGSSAAIKGRALPGDIIEIFTNNSCGSDYGSQGAQFLGTATTQADSTWTYNYTGGATTITTTATSSTDNTSPFSAAVSIEDCSNNSVDMSSYEFSNVCWGQAVEYDVNVFGSGTLLWTSTGGGTFDYPDNAYTYYYAPASDTLFFAGLYQDTLILTETPYGVCPAVSDTAYITFTPAPIAYLKSDTAVCNTVNSINLSGQVFRSSSLSWSSSTEGTSGTFSDPASLNTVYTFSDDDKAYGASIYLSTTGPGTCEPVGAYMQIYFDQANSPDAGFSDTVCSNASFQLDGYISVGGFSESVGVGYWLTSGTGEFNYYESEDSSYHYGDGYTTYYPTASSVIKTDTITLVSDNGTCPATTDTLILTLLPIPITFPGNDTVMCSTPGSQINLEGMASNVNKFKWTTTGDGVFLPNDSTTLSPYYIPGDNDRIGGGSKQLLNNLLTEVTEVNLDYGIQISIEVEETSLTNGCASFEPSLNLTINHPYTEVSITDTKDSSVSNFIVCEGSNVFAKYDFWYPNDLPDSLKFKWTTNGVGTGTFLPSDTAKAVQYVPSAIDRSKQFIPLYFTTTVPGCTSWADQGKIQALMGMASNPEIGDSTKQLVCDVDAVEISVATPKPGITGSWSLTKGDPNLVSYLNSTNIHIPLSSITTDTTIFTWKVINDFTQCFSLKEHTIYKCIEAPLNAYNVVSPNRDGKHDYFKIENIELFKNTVIIYDRWGDAVFEIENYDNDTRVFEGRSNVNGNNQLPSGTYFYQVIRDSKIEKGFLVLRN